jgi:hypothetical protein
VAVFLISAISAFSAVKHRFDAGNCRGRGKLSLPYAGIARSTIGYPDQVQRVYSQANQKQATPANEGYYSGLPPRVK